MSLKILSLPKRLYSNVTTLKLKKIAKENLEKVGMGERYWQAKPKQLSGGQKTTRGYRPRTLHES